jgi:hypothetical protein
VGTPWADVVASMIEKFSVLYADYDHDSEHEYEHDGVKLDDIQDERYVTFSARKNGHSVGRWHP